VIEIVVDIAGIIGTVLIVLYLGSRDWLRRHRLGLFGSVWTFVGGVILALFAFVYRLID
jgi:hypothetical protein